MSCGVDRLFVAQYIDFEGMGWAAVCFSMLGTAANAIGPYEAPRVPTHRRGFLERSQAAWKTVSVWRSVNVASSGLMVLFGGA